MFCFVLFIFNNEPNALMYSELPNSTQIRIRQTQICEPTVSLTDRQQFVLDLITVNMSGYAGSRDYVGTSQSPQKTTHRTTHHTEKQTRLYSDPLVAGCELFRIEIISTRIEIATRGSESVFSGMCGSLWGLLRRLRGPYVIPKMAYPVTCIACIWSSLTAVNGMSWSV